MYAASSKAKNAKTAAISSGSLAREGVEFRRRTPAHLGLACGMEHAHVLRRHVPADAEFPGSLKDAELVRLLKEEFLDLFDLHYLAGNVSDLL